MEASEARLLRGTIQVLVTVALLIPGASVATGAPSIGPAQAAPPSTTPTDALRDTFEENLRTKMEKRAGPMPVIVHFNEAVPDRIWDEDDALDVQYTFQSIPAVYAFAPDAVVETLAQRDDVTFIEDAHKPIEFLLDTATVASRAREVWDPTFTPDDQQVDTNESPSPNLTEQTGYRVDGSGVGIAVVDTGLDATHPDFQSLGKVVSNFQVTPQGVVEGGPYTDGPGGHGTAVAGVAAGPGEASGGQYAGAAPDASLYGFSTVYAHRAQDETIDPWPDGVAVSPAIAFDWILQNHEDVVPDIRIVTNSWHCAAPACRTLNQDMAHVRLSSQLAEDGVLVTWAVGNTDGEDEIAETVVEAQNPTPGIVGVASFNDRDLGTRNSCTADISAHGNPLKPGTWPDVAAPGEQITTTAAKVQIDSSNAPITTEYAPRRGTSMAAPHVAGVAALVLEANPALSPEEVERVLETSAHELDPGFCYEPGLDNLPEAAGGTTYLKADPSNPTDPANWKAGHGLVDAQKAVELALDFPGIPENEPDPVPVPEAMNRQEDGFDVTHKFYLSGDGELVRERPTGDQAQRAVLQPDQTLTFTSDPLDEGFTTGGMDAALFVGTLTENVLLPLWLTEPRPTVRVSVERVGDDGGLDRIVEAEDSWYRNTAIPIERDFYQPAEPSITFEPGDRVRLVIEAMGALGRAQTGENPFPWTAAWGSTDRPAHVGFGPADENLEQGTYEACRDRLPQCTWIDKDHPHPFFRCEAQTRFRLEWTGPPGSRAILDCNEASAVCEIPEDAEGWQTCKATTLRLTGSARRGPKVECTYQLPSNFEPPQDPELEYHGLCTNIGDR